VTEEKQGLRIRTRNLRDQVDSVTEQVLVPGDEIVYQVTHQVEYGNRETMWIRFGTGSTVRPGESTSDACDRLINFVHDKAAEACKRAVEHAQKIDTTTL
jgi:hypothetical protein